VQTFATTLTGFWPSRRVHVFDVFCCRAASRTPAEHP
jgi:hypothetical protein